MAHEPDWDSLGNIQFLLYQRVSEQLNTALEALAQMTVPTTDGDTPDDWRERAQNAILRALQIENAWALLVRHKQGEQVLPQPFRHFQASELIHWLASEISSPRLALPKQDAQLLGNRDTLREALLLLHSCAGTLGPGVRLVVGQTKQGMWFRIRYNLVREAPNSLAELMTALAAAGHWRADAALFELQRAADFLQLNGFALHYTCADDYCELAFCVPTARPAIQTTGQTLATDDDTAPPATDAQPPPARSKPRNAGWAR